MTRFSKKEANMKHKQQKIAAAMGTLLLSSLATAHAAESSFQAVALAAGYQLSAVEAACGADKKKTDDKDTADKAKEGKCGEGQCGADKMADKADKTDKAQEGKCGEGKCGEGKCGGLN
jgi:uncharacterized low-complexity protein